MTIDERRAFLESREFEVAGNSFPGGSGPLWYVREILPGGQRGLQLFIDLDSGRSGS